jgi:GH24 family phage-related lysozyme (muramidase)
MHLTASPSPSPRTPSAPGDRHARTGRPHRLLAALTFAAVVLSTTVSTAPVAAAQNGYHVNTAGGPLTVRSGPGTGYSSVGTIADETPVDISCQTTGTSVTGTYGTSTVWDKIGPGRYVADAYVWTGHDGKFLTTCASSGRKLPASLNLSAKGVSYIARFEGFVARPYNDAGGNCTIGYGHLISTNPCTAADRTRWGTITTTRGKELLRSDANRFVRGLRTSLASTPLHQYEFDALVSFAYNIGLGGFGTSSVRKDLVAKPPKYGSVPGHMKLWVKSNGTVLCGLYKRRVNEGRLFSTGSYTLTTPACPSSSPSMAPLEGDVADARAADVAP